MQSKKTIDKKIIDELTEFHLCETSAQGSGDGIPTPQQIDGEAEHEGILHFSKVSAIDDENDESLAEVRNFCKQKPFFRNGHHDIERNEFVKTEKMNAFERIEKKHSKKKTEKSSANHSR